MQAQNTSTWENVEMTLTSPTLVINEVKIDGKEQISDDKSDTNNRSNNTSVWENIEIANKNGTFLVQEIEAEAETEINVDMLTSAIESDVKSESSDIKSKTDLMSTLSKRSINQEMKKFAAKSQSDQNKFKKSDNRETGPKHGVVSSGTHKNRKGLSCYHGLHFCWNCTKFEPLIFAQKHKSYNRFFFSPVFLLMAL